MTKLLITFSERKFIYNALYWERIVAISNSLKCNFTHARRRFHISNKKYLPQSAVGTNTNSASAEIEFFMGKIAPIKPTSWSELVEKYQRNDNLAKQGTFRFGMDLDRHIKNAKNLNNVFRLPGYNYIALSIKEMAQLPALLAKVERLDCLEQLIKDPFYGPCATQEYNSLKWDLQQRDEEADRKSKLPWELRELQSIGDKFPWLCKIYYPYSHPAVPDLPSGLIAVCADGCPVFRVEPLEDFTKFRMYEVLGNTRANYFFDLNGINRQIDGSDFDFNGFKRIMESSLKMNLDRMMK